MSLQGKRERTNVARGSTNGTVCRRAQGDAVPVIDAAVWTRCVIGLCLTWGVALLGCSGCQSRSEPPANAEAAEDSAAPQPARHVVAPMFREYYH